MHNRPSLSGTSQLRRVDEGALGPEVVVLHEGQRVRPQSLHLGQRSTCVNGQCRLPQALEDEPGVGFDYLHQVELSCAVAGQDEHIWSAYLFADSYHEGWDKDDLEDYELQTAGLGQGFNIEDPLVGESLSKSPHKPREYFLKVLIVRSSQARSEWGRTIDHILSLVKQTVSILASIPTPITNTQDSARPTTRSFRQSRPSPPMRTAVRKPMGRLRNGDEGFSSAG